MVYYGSVMTQLAVSFCPDSFVLQVATFPLPLLHSSSITVDVAYEEQISTLRMVYMRLIIGNTLLLRLIIGNTCSIV